MTPHGIRTWRRRWKLSQTELGGLLGLGDPKMHVSKWERGLMRPAPYLRLALAHLEEHLRVPKMKLPE